MTVVHGCMVYTECAPKRQQLHVVPAMQQANSSVSTLPGWIIKIQIKNKETRVYKATVTHLDYMRQRCNGSAGERRITLYKSDQERSYYF